MVKKRHHRLLSGRCLDRDVDMFAAQTDPKGDLAGAHRFKAEEFLVKLTAAFNVPDFQCSVGNEFQL